MHERVLSRDKVREFCAGSGLSMGAMASWDVELIVEEIQNFTGMT